jgi:seryl-tRNA synthetase
MLDIRQIRREPELIKAALARRGVREAVVDSLVDLDARRREWITRSDDLKKRRNEVSAELGRRRKAGEDISEASAHMREVGAEIASLDAQRAAAEEEQQQILDGIPNLPDASVPDGRDAQDNVVVRTWGEPKLPSHPVRPHWEVGEELGILDFKRSAKLSGSRFWLLKADGARLERALITFMLELHTGEHGYTEILPPSLVTRDTMYATGQLPKFEEDLFRCTPNDLFLIPTSEVPLTNLHRDEILEASQLPLYYTGFTPCFRSEAGAAGRDTRGLVRVHQFHKVELVKFAHPDHSFEELEKMVANAERVLQILEIPYRVVHLCAGDMGFSAASTYDLEFWSPAQERWLEISSCSNCTDFQARRAGIRFRREPGAPTELVHTLNGSGLAVGRTMVAILENFQQEDGSILIPQALRPYMGGRERIVRS